MLSGRFLDAANERYPLVVLGAVAAQRLGVDSLSSGGRPVQVYLGGALVHRRGRPRLRCRSRPRSTAPR